MADETTTETTELDFDALPENIVENALGQLSQWGFNQTAEEPDPTPPSDEALETDQTLEPPAEEEPDVEPPPAPPGGPWWKDQTDETPEPTGEPADVPQAQAPPTDPVIAALTIRAQSDPGFRDALTKFLLGAQEPVPAQLPPPQQQGPQLPRFSEEDLENPALRATLLIVSEQQKQLQALKDEFTSTRTQLEDDQKRQFAAAASSAVSAFQSGLRLPDDLTARVRDAAVHMVPAAAASIAPDPFTGAPDPYKAMEKALEMAYWTVPEAREFEINRQSKWQEQAHSRKQKLAGIGGTSGSSPSRQPQPQFDESTEEGRKAAMVELAAQAMGLRDPNE